jgi:hypothetical protein
MGDFAHISMTETERFILWVLPARLSCSFPPIPIPVQRRTNGSVWAAVTTYILTYCCYSSTCSIHTWVLVLLRMSYLRRRPVARIFFQNLWRFEESSSVCPFHIFKSFTTFFFDDSEGWVDGNAHSVFLY